MRTSGVIVCLVALACAIALQSQETKHQTIRAGKAALQPFPTSNTFWTWYENGLTTFSFSIRNQSGHNIKSLRYRVLFFDRKAAQIDFAEGTTGPIPNGLARRESVTLDLDTGMSTRKLSVSSKIEVLGFDQEDSP
jgi:hypothetical protein